MTDALEQEQIARLRADYLQNMRRIPAPVAIIATAHSGERTGLAATAWASLCADPPMLLACINGKASAHALILQAGAFSVNLLPQGARELVAVFSGQRELAGEQRFASPDWEEGPKGQPMLRSAIVSFECALEDSHDYGTHTIMIGRVGEMRGKPDGEPLLYVDGAFASAAPV